MQGEREKPDSRASYKKSDTQHEHTRVDMTLTQDNVQTTQTQMYTKMAYIHQRARTETNRHSPHNRKALKPPYSCI